MAETDQQTEKNSRNSFFFILGVSFIPIGIGTDNPAFIGVGVVFMIMGFSNQQIEKNKGITPEQKAIRKKIIRMIAFVLLVLLLAVILITFLRQYGLIQ